MVQWQDVRLLTVRLKVRCPLSLSVSSARICVYVLFFVSVEHIFILFKKKSLLRNSKTVLEYVVIAVLFQLRL